MTEPAQRPGRTLELELNVHSCRDWTPGTVLVEVGLDDIVLSCQGEPAGRIPRDLFREWMSHPDANPNPWIVDGMKWFRSAGLVVLTIGPHATALVVLPDEIALLRRAIA